jgi:hypothetical protein
LSLVDWRDLDAAFFDSSNEFINGHIVGVKVNLESLLDQLLALPHWIVFGHKMLPSERRRFFVVPLRTLDAAQRYAAALVSAYAEAD